MDHVYQCLGIESFASLKEESPCLDVTLGAFVCVLKSIGPFYKAKIKIKNAGKHHFTKKWLPERTVFYIVLV